MWQSLHVFISLGLIDWTAGEMIKLKFTKISVATTLADGSS
jgi:hypothetical protein